MISPGWSRPGTTGSIGRNLPETLKALLEEVGRTYVPALLANAAAIDAGADEVSTEIGGQALGAEAVSLPGALSAVAAPGVCGALDGEDRTRADQVLEGTGCEALFVRP